MTNEKLFLASEVTQLESLLASIPDDRIIDRMGLEARLASVKKELATLPEQVTQKARLTFRGKPVLGSHGMTADFGTKATAVFTDAFAMIAAALSEGLRDMGPVPDRDRNQLLITGTAIGSFGFEFELPAAEASLFPEKTKAQEAMEKVESLFRLAAQGSDDEVAEVIEEIHPRAVRKVHEFLDFLVQQQAWCGLEFEERSFRFSNYEQLKVSSERLKDDNIQEKQESYQGEFQGVLPASRTFEFKLSNQDGVLKGKVDKAISDPDVLNREWLHKPATVTLSMMQVGQGKPRYTLMKLDDLKL
jgi:hypothetical protein